MSFPHGIPFEIDPVSVVDQAVEYSVGNSRIVDNLVPVLNWQLSCNDGGAGAVPVPPLAG